MFSVVEINSPFGNSRCERVGFIGEFRQRVGHNFLDFEREFREIANVLFSKFRRVYNVVNLIL